MPLLPTDLYLQFIMCILMDTLQVIPLVLDKNRSLFFILDRFLKFLAMVTNNNRNVKNPM